MDGEDEGERGGDWETGSVDFVFGETDGGLGGGMEQFDGRVSLDSEESGGGRGGMGVIGDRVWIEIHIKGRKCNKKIE